MGTTAKIIKKVRRAIHWAESPKVQQKWRAVRLAAAVVVSSGIIDQIEKGTATRTAVTAVVVAAVEVFYRAVKPHGR